MLMWLLTVPPGWLSQILYALGASLITLTGASALGQYIRVAMTVLDVFLGHLSLLQDVRFQDAFLSACWLELS